MTELIIGTRRIADDEPCYVIAELGHNHGGSVDMARKMIRVAAACGASAVKLQKRDNATLYSKAMLAQPYDHEHSFGKTYGGHRFALELGFNGYVACLAQAQASKVACFATAFDEKSVDMLVDLKVPAIKIASGGLTDLQLLNHVAQARVPVILSTGGGDALDIDRAVQTITKYTTKLAVLHCTAAYPVLNFEELNLRCILTLRSRYPDLVVGWSGHDSGIAMALIAYAFGARILEKHFTLNRACKGTDHGFSLEPVGLRKLCRDLERAKWAMGDGVKVFYPSEQSPISKMRRTRLDGQWQIGTAAEQESSIV